MAVEKIVDDEQDPKRQRSPNFPTIGFKAALDLVRGLYDKEKRHPMTRELAVKYMGYNSMNGRSKMVLSALRKFGLIELAGDELVRVTEDAQALFVMPPEDQQRAEIIQKLALRPDIYRVLLSEFPGDLPSDANLRAHLILKRKFTEAAADVFLIAFRETMAELPRIDAAPAQPNAPQDSGSSFGSFVDPFGKPALAATPAPKPSPDQPASAPPSVDVQVINLGDGVKAELRILGRTEPKHIKKLIKFLQLSLEDEVDPLS